jgi:hypothetical protein
MRPPDTLGGKVARLRRATRAGEGTERSLELVKA